MELEPLTDHDPHEAGPYHLRGRLREGRAGTAYLGRSPDGLFAEVTVVSDQVAWDPKVLALLSDGIDSARRLRTAHVQRVRGADLRARRPWFAGDFLPGPSLREAVETYGPLPPAAVRSLAAGLADALDAIHAAGQVHRGLDPSTVVLTADGPTVIGLGIARALESATVTLPRLVPDAVGYLPPEVARGYEPGSPADIFGLGAVLTYAATGHGPFGTGASSELVRRMRQDEPDLAGVPDDLLEVVAACVRAGAGERPTLAAVRRRLSSGRTDSWDLPADLAGTFAQWAVLGRGRSAPLAPAISAEPTTPLTPEAGLEPAATKKLDPGAGDDEAAAAPGAGRGLTARPVSILPRQPGGDGSGRRSGRSGSSRFVPLLMAAVAVSVAVIVFAAVIYWL